MNSYTKEELIKAIEEQDLPRIRDIVENNSSLINETDEDGVPLSHLAMRTGELDIIKYIVEYSFASMNTKDSKYRSVLHHAVLSGKVSAIPYLVERVGMSAFDGDRNLVTPFDLAHNLGYKDIEDYFCKYYNTTYENTYHNPIRQGMFPDPSIVRVGNDYYMVNSTFIFFPCIPVSHSTDLVHWEIIGHAVTNPSWAPIDELEGGRGFWAPDISYKDGKYYIVATLRLNDVGTKRRRQMIVSSDKPEGPYSKPVYVEEEGIDPSLFHDEDGRSYMLLNRGARIFEVDLNTGNMLSKPTLLYYGDQKRAPEGPHLLKKDGYYYLFEAEGGTGEGHRITVSRSDKLMGTYTPCPYNPIMRQWVSAAPIQRCGHGKPVMTQYGDWYMVYLCGRQIDGKYSMLGRETALDPVTWTADGWPIVNNLQGPSTQQIKPNLPAMVAMDGVAGFGTDKLSGDFMTPRTPTPKGISVSNGVLTLEGSACDLNSTKAKNVLVMRQPGFTFKSCVTMDLDGLIAKGQNAGMTCYYDENTYIKFGVYKEDESYIIKVFEKIDEDEHIAFESSLDNSVKSIDLSIDTDYLTRTFSYKTPEGKVTTLGTLENVYYLCDEGIKKGKRFTGAMIGVYAYAGDAPTFVKFKDFQICTS